MKHMTTVDRKIDGEERAATQKSWSQCPMWKKIRADACKRVGPLISIGKNISRGFGIGFGDCLLESENPWL
jgi:hypothetical protein